MGQDGDRRGVAHGVRRRLLLHDRPEDRVGPYRDRTPFPGHEGRPAARRPGALQRAGGVTLGSAVAEGYDAIPRRKLRAVEREVEGVDSPDVEAATVLPQEVLADPGRVVGGPDADEKQPPAGGCVGGELVGRVPVLLEDADGRL